MTWWSWMILGAVLFGAELVAVDAQFYLVFLGLSAALVGLAGAIGITAPEWAQWMAFATLSLVSMITFRKSLYMKIRGNVAGFKEGIAGESIEITEALESGSEARVEFRGTMWTVRNVGDRTIDAGTRANVVKTQGILLHVRID